MKDNSEGSEPIKLTEGKVISLDDDPYNNSPLIRQLTDIIVMKTDENETLKQQLKEERNKAIQWCINSVNNISDKETLLKKLESLKSDSK